MISEHALQLKRGRITRENSRQLSRLPHRFLIASIKKRRGYCKSSTKGGGNFFLPTGDRQQRATIKVAYTKNSKSRSWAAHGSYLQRNGAQRHDEKGQGFNQDSSAIDIAETLHAWQNDNTEHFFKIILSPEFAERIDLPVLTKTLIPCMEQDLQTRLQWVAIDHYNTDHPHVHLLIRGCDDKGEPLTIDANYLSKGIRQRTQDLLTHQLGLRTQHDIATSRSRQIDKNYVTQLDRSLLNKAENNYLCYEDRIPNNTSSRERRLQEIARIKYLETLGLATRCGKKTWQLSADLVPTLHELQLSNDIIKNCVQHPLSYQAVSGAMKPTSITAENPFRGRVIGMGLHQELHDRRYLLIAGQDGKTHYVLVGNSIIKSRDQRAFKNGDNVVIESRCFKTDKGEEINYLAITKQSREKCHDNKLDPELHKPYRRKR